METLLVALIFFLVTCGAAFFPFALVLWGKGGENPNVFVLSGVLAMIFAAANLLLVHRRALGRKLPRILAGLGLVIAAWMITYPVYQNWLCPVCLLAGGTHQAKPVAGIILLLAGVIVFFLGWRVTRWGSK
jgi:hypothetical protein